MSQQSDYLRSLVDRTPFSQRQIAERLEINDRTFRHYLNDTAPKPPPFCLVFALECLAGLHGSRPQIHLASVGNEVTVPTVADSQQPLSTRETP